VNAGAQKQQLSPEQCFCGSTASLTCTEEVIRGWSRHIKQRLRWWLLNHTSVDAYSSHPQQTKWFAVTSFLLMHSPCSLQLSSHLHIQHKADPGTSTARETHSFSQAKYLMLYPPSQALEPARWRLIWVALHKVTARKMSTGLLFIKLLNILPFNSISPYSWDIKGILCRAVPGGVKTWIHKLPHSCIWMYWLAFSMPETGCPWKLRWFISIQSILRHFKATHLPCIIQTLNADTLLFFVTFSARSFLLVSWLNS